IVVGGSFTSVPPKARVAGSSHHHGAEGCPTGAGGDPDYPVGYGVDTTCQLRGGGGRVTCIGGQSSGPDGPG
ncbi:hypothetical protein KI387_040073, partial [Taxus chinensis]